MKVASAASSRTAWFQGGIVFKAQRLCVSLNCRLESSKEEEPPGRRGEVVKANGYGTYKTVKAEGFALRGFGVWGFGSGICGFWFGVWGLGSRIWGLWFGLVFWSLGRGVKGLGLGLQKCAAVPRRARI